MVKQVRINLNPAAAADEAAIRKIAATLAGIDQAEISSLRILKRSVDARKKNIRVELTVEIFTGQDSEIPVIALRIEMRNTCRIFDGWKWSMFLLSSILLSRR